MTLIRTSGVNVPPRGFRAALADGSLQESVESGVHDDEYITSSLHLGIAVSAGYRGQQVAMDSSILACGSECRKQLLLAGITNAGSSQSVEIVRFAKHGRTQFMPKGVAGLGVQTLNAVQRLKSRLSGKTFMPIGATWLVYMEDGFPLAGEFIPSGAGDSGVLRMAGRMIITLQEDNSTSPRRLKSRKEPILEGVIDSWPPRGSVLRLINAPIEYFDEKEVDLLDSSPILTVESNLVTFGTDAVTLLEVEPAIVRLAHISDETTGRFGVSLEWRDVRQEVLSSGDPAVDYYNIYRLYKDDELNGWMLVRTIPSTLHRWTDFGNDGTKESYYLVLAAAEYPFGYLYESSIREAARLPARQ